MAKKKKIDTVAVPPLPPRNNASTLSKTIISLLPKVCTCNSTGKCLRCVFGNGDDHVAMSYLIRPNDPSEFHNFMSSCFVVLPHHAPPLDPLSTFTRLWSQLKIVEMALQASVTNVSSNVICDDYEQINLHSNTVKALTNWTWQLVLKRVGDSVMFYLLKHTLIFMPISCNTQHQVAGPLVNQLFAGSPMNIGPDDGISSVYSRCQRKRKRCDGGISNAEEPVNKVPVRSSQQNLTGSFGRKMEVDVGIHSSAANTLMPANCSHGRCVPEEQCIEKLEVKPGKNLRLPSWQRRKRRKRLILQESSTQEPSRKFLNDEGDLIKVYQHGSVKNKCQGLFVPTSEKSIDNQIGADLKSEQPMHLCPCCSVFQSLSSVSKNVEINRRLTFYNSNYSSSLFLKKHVLFPLKSGVARENDLLVYIFGLPKLGTRNTSASCFHKRELCSHGSSCFYHSLIKLLRVFLRRAKKCQHESLLEKHCPSRPLFQLDGDGDVRSTPQVSKMPSELSSSNQSVNQGVKQMPKRLTPTKTEVIQHQFGLSRPYCLKNEVVSFVWAVCRSIVPPDLLGSPSGRRTLRRNISRFIRLRRFEKFSLKQCLHELDVSKFPLFSNMESLKCHNAFAFVSETKQIPGMSSKSRNIDSYTLKKMLLERWIFWFFTNIVVPLIQAKFYVTESEHGKQNMYYYRKSSWRKLSERITTTRLKDQSYHFLDNASVAKILSQRPFGFSKVRLCPKESGARPIANLRAPSKFCIEQSFSHAQLSRNQGKGRTNKRYEHYWKSVNTILQDLYVIFKDLKAKEPERWGSTVVSYNDVHRKLCSFLRHLKEGQPTMPMVYIVVADVQKAFDTVNQDKLLSILDEIEMADTYSIQKSRKTFCMKKSMWTSRNLMSIRGNKSASTEAIHPVRQKTCQRFISQEQSKTVRWEHLKLILKEHLKKNVLKLGQCFYLQTVGIPQGSVLSTLLCTLYYGHMERSVIFPYLAISGHDTQIRADNDNGSAAVEATPNGCSSSSQYLLLRYVDDFLFVSTSKKQASSFFTRLERGVDRYKCSMNQEKFCMNFDSGGAHKLDQKRLLVANDGASFLKWSGLLINSCSLEVQADYSRYLTDHLSSTLTVNWQHRPGRILKTKLFAYLRPKCHPIFFDTRINSPATIRLNVYQAFVVCAMKFHCHVRELSLWCKLYPGSCFESIMKSLRYMYKLMRRKMRRMKCASDCHHVLQVAAKEVSWLGLVAFIKVLKKKSRHTILLRLLKTKLATISHVGRSSKLKYAVDDSNSSYMWKIKY